MQIVSGQHTDLQRDISLVVQEYLTVPSTRPDICKSRLLDSLLHFITQHTVHRTVGTDMSPAVLEQLCSAAYAAQTVISDAPSSSLLSALWVSPLSDHFTALANAVTAVQVTVSPASSAASTTALAGIFCRTQF